MESVLIRRTLRYFFFVWVFIGSSYLQPGWGQTLTLVDASTGQPIEEALILDIDSQYSVSTNIQGQADLSGFARDVRLEIYSFGYEAVDINLPQLKELEYQLALRRSTFLLDEIVVGASRWRDNKKNVVAEITIIDPEVVALQNPQTAADLLGLSDRVFIQKSQQGGGSPMIRGFATNRLVYSIDGVRMNNAIFRSGNLQNVISLDPFSIEKTEVVFGPGSVLYGSDGIGGVMSFQTLGPKLSNSDELSPTGNFSLRHSSANDEFSGHFDIQLSNKRWAILSSISRWSYGDLRQGQHGPRDYLKSEYVLRIDGQDRVLQQEDELVQSPSSYDQFNMLHKLRFQASPNLNLVYAFHYSETSPYGRYDRHNRRRNGAPRYAEWNYGPQEWQMHHLRVSSDKPTKLYDKLAVNLAFQNFGESRIQRNFNDLVRSERKEKVQAYSVNWDFIKKWEQWQLTYGLEWVRNVVDSEATALDIESGQVLQNSTRYPDGEWASRGIYMGTRYSLGSKLSLEAGLRYNSFALEADFRQNVDFIPLPFVEADLRSSALTGSICVRWVPMESWIFKGSLGTAFRAPNIDDIGKVFDSEPSVLVVPNPQLDAEYAYHGEMTIARSWNQRTQIELTGFFTFLDDAMIRRPFVLGDQDSLFFEGVFNEVQAIQNAAEAYVYGLQFSIDLNFDNGLYASSTINWQEGREEEENGTLSPSRHAAPIFGATRVGYKNEKLELQIYTQYQGERSFEQLAVSERGKTEIYAKDENGDSYAPAWYTLNIKSTVRLKNDWNLSVGVENLTDQRYRTYSSGISGAGRNFVVSVGSSF